MSKICRSGSWIAAAVMAAGLMGGQVYGADELDQQLGPKDQTMGPPAPTTAPKADATDKPVTPKVEVRTDTVKAPSENDIVSPDAVKKVDDADLVKDLTGENKGQASADPAVKFKEFCSFHYLKHCFNTSHGYLALNYNFSIVYFLIHIMYGRPSLF